MSTNSSVVLRFMAQGASTVTGIFDNLKKQRQDLEKGVNIPVDADAKPATTKLDDVNRMLADLAKKHATATADVNDSAGKAKLLQMGLTLKRLNDYVAKPTVSVTGLAKAEISLLKFDAELDSIGKKNEKANISAGGGIAPGEVAPKNSAANISQLGGGIVNPGTILTALAAIPFAAQAAGMAITFGLGGALAGVAILAASKSNNVRKSFDNLRNNANHDLTQIGDPFKGVMESIFSTATDTLNKLTPIFAGATATIAGPFKTFADAFIKAFAQPSVQLAIANIAASFGLLLTAATPQLAGVVSNIATGITKLVQAVASNPQAFADFISDLGKVAGGTLTVIASLTRVANWIEANWDWFKWIVVPEIAAIEYVIANFDMLRHDIAAHFSEIMSNTIDVWNKTWTETIGRLIQFGHDVEANFVVIRHNVAAHMSEINSNVIDSWNKTWTQTIGRLIQFGHELEDIFNGIKHAIASDVDAMRSTIVNTWNSITHFVSSTVNGIRNNVSSAFSSIRSTIANDASAFVNTIRNAFNTIVSWARGIGGRVKSAIGNLGSLLNSAGRSLINGLFSGMKAVLSGVGSWVRNNIYAPIVGAIKSAFGIHSPSTEMAKLGGHMVSGLIKGILKANPHAFVTKIFGSLPKALEALVKKGLVSIKSLPSKAIKELGSLGGDVGSFFSGLFSGGGGGVSSVPAQSGSAAAAQKFASAHLGQFGWSQDQMSALIPLWNQESGWNANAVNPSSGAYGIPQALGHGHPYSLGDYANQVLWGLDYIKGRYGSPAAAEAHERAFNWYAGGTRNAQPGWAWVGEKGPELMNMRGGESVIPNHQLGGSTTIIQVTVAGHALASKAEIGRTVSEALEYSKRHGNK